MVYRNTNFWAFDLNVLLYRYLILIESNETLAEVNEDHLM